MTFDEACNTIWESELLEFMSEGKISGGVYKNKTFEEVVNLHLSEIKNASALIAVLPEDNEEYETIRFLKKLDMEYKIVFKDVETISIIIFGIKNG